MRLNWAALAGTIICALPLLSGCGSGPTDKAALAAPKDKMAYPVRAQPISVQPVAYDLQAIGSIEAQDVYRVDAPVAGTITDVTFNEGDQVQTSQVLCRISPETYKLNVLKAKATYQQAVADLADTKRKTANDIERAKLNLADATLAIERRDAIKTAGAITDEEIRSYQLKKDLAAVDLNDVTQAADTLIKILEATAAEQEAAWKLAEDDLRKSTIFPPIEGVIESRTVTNGMYVSPGTAPAGTVMGLATIVDRRTLKLRFKLSEKDSAAVKEGVKVTFSVPAWPGHVFEAEVYHIGVQADPTARIVECLARITKDLDKLKPGFFASVRLVTGGSQTAVVVPSAAVLPTEKGFVAFVVNNGKAVRRSLRVGKAVTDNSVEILSGLAAGETLVTEGANALQEGVPVRLLAAADGGSDSGTRAGTGGLTRPGETELAGTPAPPPLAPPKGRTE